MYQHDFIQNFDLGLFGPDTGMTSSQLQHGEGCQQLRQPQQLQLSLAERMQGDKQETLYSMSYDIKFNLVTMPSNVSFSSSLLLRQRKLPCQVFSALLPILATHRRV
jgi:hypothetical protein